MVAHFVFGLFVGAFFGILGIALCLASSGSLSGFGVDSKCTNECNQGRNCTCGVKNENSISE